MMGDPASPSRDRASHGAADGVSTLRASPAIALLWDQCVKAAYTEIQRYSIGLGYRNVPVCVYRDRDGAEMWRGGMDGAHEFVNAQGLRAALTQALHLTDIEHRSALGLSDVIADVGHICIRKLLAQGIEAQRAETQSGSVHESPVGEADAPNPSADSSTTPDRS